MSTTKKILGLDLGTNSIGWALVERDLENEQGRILGVGTRIIPMSQDILGDFGKGNSVSQTAERTGFRSARRLHERYLLRRERLHRVLNLLGYLPEHYSSQIDFEKRLGKFKDQQEPKIAYKPVWNDLKQKFDYEFLFKRSFEEMLADFRQHQPHMLVREEGSSKLIPYDWTIYYLRKKALSKKIEREELAWILLNFNQKRGYYQLRGEEEEENHNKLVEYHSLKIVEVIADVTQNGKKEIWYSLVLENGWVYRRSSKTPLFDWKGKVRDFIVTTDLNVDGSIKKDKDGVERRSFRAPGDDDWTLLKKKTEREIDKSSQTVGEYIYDTLVQNPGQKIKGKLVRTIERKFYRSELELILRKQMEFHSELRNEELYYDCVRELYRTNDAHQMLLKAKNIVHLFINDIIFYQRPLRSQKSSIGNCSLEYRPIKDCDGNLLKDVKGKQVFKPLKSISKSNPYYQEFRIWQWMYNLSIYRRDDDTNVTHEFLASVEDWEELYEFLNNRKEIEQKPLLKFFLERKGLKGKVLNTEIEKLRWNYVEDKKYPCNETLVLISARLTKVEDIYDNFLTRETLQSLWHLIYSVTDREDYLKAIKSFAFKNKLHVESFVDAFKRFPPFKSEYGSFSEKAIKKMLPLMRMGKYWSWDAIDKNSKARIEKIITGEYDETIQERVRVKALNLTREDHFQGLQLWLAQYIVYGRHSEAAVAGKWNSVDDLEEYLREFRQHSLRNPIVELVITETLRVVKDVWKQYGGGGKDFINEIHIELGRDMKNSADDRKRLANLVTVNENTNFRIKALLAEMVNDANVENVRPYSPMQQEILKVYEEGVLNSDIEIDEEILKISKAAQPSSSELKRYKLWLEQKYRSPYTGEVIPLNKLFTTDYEVEHVIPQSRFFDDSLSNKVICEAAVNKLKGNQLGLEFIKNHHGEKVQLGFGKEVQIFEISVYEDFVKRHYDKNRTKRNKLMMEEIPERMIERQMNDTRYISKFIFNVLSNIVRSEKNDDGVNSTNVIPGNGKITAQLKQDWGLNDVWNEMILPRFKRLNKLTNSTEYTAWSENHQKFLPTVPLKYSRGFSKKRIDHRHHAMDALVIACTTRDLVNYMNNAHALRKGKSNDEKQKIRHDLRSSLCDKKYNGDSNSSYRWVIKKPWDGFTIDAREHLENIVVSFKQNLRVINKATNYYEKWNIENGVKTKVKVKQKRTNWSIRKPLHKDTVSGKVELRGVKVPKGKICTATRKSIDTSFDLKTIESVTDTGIQKILKNYLASRDGNPELAFSPEGLEDLNRNIQKYNDDKPHQPVYKVRVFEIGSKFPIGEIANKKKKFVEAAKGTNLFFAVYIDESGRRSFETVSLNAVIERLKQGLGAVPEINYSGSKLLFCLSPNDLVYVPTPDELEMLNTRHLYMLSKEQMRRIYKFVSCTGNEGHFVPQYYAKEIIKNEMGTNSKSQNSLEGIQIKSSCVKLKVDRLGRLYSPSGNRLVNEGVDGSSLTSIRELGDKSA